jgi:hypothetical protein
MPGVAIRFRVDRDRSDAQFTCREEDANRDLAAVCNEEPIEGLAKQSGTSRGRRPGRITGV